MRPGRPADAHRRVKLLTLFATALGSAVAFLDTTVVIVALPQMEEDLGLGLAGQQWVYLAYALCALGVLPRRWCDRRPRRPAADVRRRRRLLAAASLLTALAPSEGVLIGGRALQGVGGAVLTTTSLALLRVTWAGEAGRAIGLWTSLTSLATVAGPPLGGVIVQTVSWRWVFLINVPLAVVTIALALAGRGRTSSPRGARRSISSARRSSRSPSRRSRTRSSRCATGGSSRCCRSSSSASPRSPGSSSGRCGRATRWCRRRSCACPASRLRTSSRSCSTRRSARTCCSCRSTCSSSASRRRLPGSCSRRQLGLVLLAPRFGRYADRHGPRLPIAAGAATIGIAVAAAPARHDPARGVDVGGGAHRPLRARACRGRRADHRRGALPAPAASRASPPGSTRRSRASAACSRSPRSGALAGGVVRCARRRR